MAKPYRIREAIVAQEVEATPGTAVALVEADTFFAQDVVLTANFQNTPNESLTGTMCKEPGVSGVRTGTLAFKIPLKGSGAAGTAPGKASGQGSWGELLLACGCSETIVGGTSVTYKPAAPETYLSLGVQYPGYGAAGEDLLFHLKGCQGNCKLTWKAGEFMFAEFTFTGVWEDTLGEVDGSQLVRATAWDATTPNAFLSPAMTFHTVANLTFETLEMDFGNEVVIRPDANAGGALTAQITNRRVTGTVDLEAEKLATFDIWNLTNTNATGAISMTGIGAAGNIIDLDIPKARFFSPNLGDRSGILTTPVSYEGLRSAVGGNDSFSIILT